jgi:DUF4097 and DUF4098 domain-containing protein YvlB
VKAETVKAKSVNGSITLDTDAESIEAESVNGSIHLTASSQGVGIQTKTVHGSTHINVVSDHISSLLFRLVLSFLLLHIANN